MTILAAPLDMRPHQWNEERYPLMAHIARHPFIYASLLLHALLLLIFFSIGASELKDSTLAKNESAISTSMQRAQQGELQKRVQEIGRIKSLLEKSLSGAEGGVQNQDETEADDTPQTAEQSMRRAQNLLVAIRKMEDQIRIRELARVLQIPREQAAKKLVLEQELGTAKAKKETLSLEQIEQQARDALAQRQRQLEHAESGYILGGVRNFVRQAQELMVLDGSGGGGNASQTDEPDQTGNGMGADVPAQGKDGEPTTAPPMQRATLRSNSANTFGSGGSFAQRASIHNWYIIGPFEDAGKASIEKKYPPEMAIDLDATYRGKFGRPLNWTYLHTNLAPMIPTLRGEFAVYYGYAEINMESEGDWWLEISADDAAKVWLNRRAVWVRSNESQSGKHQLRVDRRKLHFNQGRNTFLFKIYNGIDAMFFSLVLASEAGG